MKICDLLVKTFQFSYPTSDEPRWKNDVERWYQLDASAYGLPQAYDLWKEQLPKPSAIILASSGASNETDFHFAQTQGLSPSKFVHTLPNVRCSPLCQVMKWFGPVYCVSRGDRTQVLAIREAVELLAELPCVWVLSVQKSDERYQVSGYFFEKTLQSGNYEIWKNHISSDMSNDTKLSHWLNLEGSVNSQFSLPGNYAIIKTKREERL